MLLDELIRDHGYRLSVYHAGCFEAVLLHDAHLRPARAGYGSTLASAVDDLRRGVFGCSAAELECLGTGQKQ